MFFSKAVRELAAWGLNLCGVFFILKYMIDCIKFKISA